MREQLCVLKDQAGAPLMGRNVNSGIGIDDGVTGYNDTSGLWPPHAGDYV